MIDKLVQVTQDSLKRKDVLISIIITAILVFGMLYYIWIPTLNYMLESKEEASLAVKENNEVLKNKFSIYDERIKLYQERIQFLKEKLTACSGSNLSVSIADIRLKLQGVIRTPYYKIIPFPDNDLVAGDNGKYYIIDIKKAHKKEKINFEAGRYTISSFDSEYTSSIAQFVTDIMKNIAGKVEHKIFVKGSADISGNTTFSNSLDPQYKYKTVHYYSQDYANPERFIPIVGHQGIPDPYQNKHLPNLRARFISDKLKNIHDMDSTILDGSVSLKVDEKDRNVTLLLFVRW